MGRQRDASDQKRLAGNINKQEPASLLLISMSWTLGGTTNCRGCCRRNETPYVTAQYHASEDLICSAQLAPGIVSLTALACKASMRGLHVDKNRKVLLARSGIESLLRANAAKSGSLTFLALLTVADLMPDITTTVPVISRTRLCLCLHQ